MIRQDFTNGKSAADSHVVLLTNYVRKHHVLAYQELEKRVGKLSILLSTPMEPDRAWKAEWDSLDVTVQKSWMFTTKWRHGTEFTENNYVHVPIDTSRRLKKLNPDIVFSYEMGMRTFFCSRFRRKHPGVPLVMVGNMSEYIEKGRGYFRRLLRRVLRNRVDYSTYNGPSCRHYLKQLGFPEDRMFHLPYCFDFDKAFHGDKSYSTDGVRRLLFVGVLHPRKGLLRFARCLKKWSLANPEQRIEFVICGEGPQQDEIASYRTESLNYVFKGNCDSAELQQAYENTDVCVFPTMADEWGLVTVESMASGVPLLASRYAQSVESLCIEGENSWLYMPDNEPEMMEAIGRSMSTPIAEIERMGTFSRRCVEHITPERTADLFCDAINSIFLGNPDPVNGLLPVPKMTKTPARLDPREDCSSASKQRERQR